MAYSSVCSYVYINKCLCIHLHVLEQSQLSPSTGLLGSLSKQQSSNPLLQLTVLVLDPGTARQLHYREWDGCVVIAGVLTMDR